VSFADEDIDVCATDFVSTVAANARGACRIDYRLNSPGSRQAAQAHTHAVATSHPATTSLG
jgi:hypothetical protein